MEGLLAGGMEDWHWFLLGVTAALAPGLVVLAILMARSMEQPAGTEESRE